MALDKSALITAIQNALRSAVGIDDDMLTVATAIADAIDTYVKTGTPTGTAGGDPLVGGAIT